MTLFNWLYRPVTHSKCQTRSLQVPICNQGKAWTDLWTPRPPLRSRASDGKLEVPGTSLRHCYRHSYLYYQEKENLQCFETKRAIKWHIQNRTSWVQGVKEANQWEPETTQHVLGFVTDRKNTGRYHLSKVCKEDALKRISSVVPHSLAYVLAVHLQWPFSQHSPSTKRTVPFHAGVGWNTGATRQFRSPAVRRPLTQLQAPNEAPIDCYASIHCSISTQAEHIRHSELSLLAPHILRWQHAPENCMSVLYFVNQLQARSSGTYCWWWCEDFSLPCHFSSAIPSAELSLFILPSWCLIAAQHRQRPPDWHHMFQPLRIRSFLWLDLELDSCDAPLFSWSCDLDTLLRFVGIHATIATLRRNPPELENCSRD